MNQIEQLLKEVIGQAAEGNEGFCVLLEARTAPDKWVQLTWEAINGAYPFSTEPLAKVRELALPDYPYLEVSDWKPGKFVTFAHGAERTDQIATFVTAYFQNVLGVSAAEAHLRVERQQL